MKKIKLLLIGFVVITIAGSAFAFKPFFGQGSVYCGKTDATHCNTRKDFRRNCFTGTSTKPCGVTGTTENPSYIYDEHCNCVQNDLGVTYDVVSAGK